MRKTHCIPDKERRVTCHRCGGFEVFDYIYGASACAGFRCINCGAVRDIRLVMAFTARSSRGESGRRSESRRSGADRVIRSSAGRS